MAKAEKIEDLKETIKSIEKDFGAGIISYGKDEIGTLEVIPFSIISMNRITGIGGIPKGRITDFHGMDGTFKTTFCLDLIAQCQKSGGTCALIDAEYAFSPEYAEGLGVDIDSLILVHPSSAEEAYTILEKLVDTKEVDLIVLDSTTSLSPNAELLNDFGASNMGVMARLSGQFYRKLTAKLGKSNTALVLVGQLREVLGGYVPMKAVPGGNAIKFFASMRFEVSKSQIKDGTSVIGITLKVKNVKNKLAIPYLMTEVEAIYGYGIDKQKDLINEAILYGMIKAGGAGWLTLPNGIKLQGVDNVKKYLIDNDVYLSALEQKIKEYI